MNEQTVNPKCSNCKCYFTQTELKSSGLPFKTCQKCRTRDKQTRNNNNKTVELDINKLEMIIKLKKLMNELNQN
jgi:hypothetical protein